MTTRSCAAWDEVNATPFEENAAGAGDSRRPRCFTPLYGGRDCATTAAGQEWTPLRRQIAAQRSTSGRLHAGPSLVRGLAVRPQGPDRRRRCSASRTGSRFPPPTRTIRTDSLRSQNPLGKIPALILENGETIFDSAVIVEYLDWLAGGGKIIPSEPKARFRSLTQEALADGIADAAVLLRYEIVWREPEQRSEKWMAYQSDKIARALRAFEEAPPEELSDVGTIALASALGYLDLRFEGAWRRGASAPRRLARRLLRSHAELRGDAVPGVSRVCRRGRPAPARPSRREASHRSSGPGQVYAIAVEILTPRSRRRRRLKGRGFRSTRRRRRDQRETVSLAIGEIRTCR